MAQISIAHQIYKSYQHCSAPSNLSISTNSKMNVLHTLDFDLAQDGATASEPPLALGNLNGEDSEHMYLFDPNADYESRHGRFKNYYGQYIGDRSSKMPVHKKLKGFSKKGYSKNVMSPVATKLLNRVVNGNFKVSLTIGETRDFFGIMRPVAYFVISTDMELDSDCDPEYTYISKHGEPSRFIMLFSPTFSIIFRTTIISILILNGFIGICSPITIIIIGAIIGYVILSRVHTNESIDKAFKEFSFPTPKKNDVCAYLYIGNSFEMKVCQSPILGHILDSKIQSIAETHAMHLTVRHCGLSIAKLSLHAFTALSNRVLQSWQQLEGPPANSNYSLVLDSMITIIDTTMLIEGKDYVSNSLLLYQLGEVLEACGRYNDAAWIYLDRASRMEKGFGWREEKADAYNAAGIAFKYAGQVSKSEFCYIQAWELAAPGGLEHSQMFRLILENLNRLYVGCGGEKLNRYDFTPYDMKRFDIILETLMDTSGYYRFGDGHITLLNIDKSNLKEHLRSPIMARKFLQNLPTKSPKEFRQALLDCWLDRSLFVIVGKQGTGTGKEHSESMQELVTENFDKVPKYFDAKCEACGKLESETKKLLNCPCLAVRYCSKVCQKAHFKTHKKHCAYKSKKGKK
ncbi:hypothetical protein CTEN210_09585 [Chaetoceros tenuissimus]|uniref:MYND-type domain-containing protein n=1 Tax=Chaetoceros tenuissimus TaxID=426638 RepID=A0AAD3CWD3_9STRA|nr:hypothetical protein CTEN210_09585 [Chaetoceros tenuissimus]